eukprot:403340138
MSTQKGNMKKQGQKHQNDTKFAHNKKSKKTQKILASPLDCLCHRCLDILQWKIAYRKYKPLTALSKCNICQQRNITKAYRTICEPCAKSQKHPDTLVKLLLCTKCSKDCSVDNGAGKPGYAIPELSRQQRSEKQAREEVEMEETLKSLKIRCRRTILRKLDAEEITFDPVKKIFLYVDSEEQYQQGKKRDGGAESDDDEDDSDEDDESGDDNEEEKKTDGKKEQIKSSIKKPVDDNNTQVDESKAKVSVKFDKADDKHESDDDDEEDKEEEKKE